MLFEADSLADMLGAEDVGNDSQKEDAGAFSFWDAAGG